MTIRILIFACCCLSLPLCLGQSIAPESITIYRDSFGVPHIHAPTDAGAAYGMAWVQAEDDFKTVQMSLLPLRGRMAEFMGKDGAILDVAAAMIGLDTLVEQRYETDLSPEFCKLAEAFAAGLTAYGEGHPDELLLKDLLPFTGQDVIKGYVLETVFLTGLEQPLSDILSNRIPENKLPLPRGSNAFAFSPRKTADSLTWFCSNSHQPLEGMFSWYEVHVMSDEGWNTLGATFPGGITPFVGTNEHLAWTHTVNHPDLADIYQLDMHPDGSLRYRFDGKWLPLREETIRLRVKIMGGLLRLPVKQTFYRSVYGLALKNDQGYFALRFSANHRITAAEQWYRMNKAKTWEAFHEALEMQGIPGTNIVYADREGNIFYVGNALLPVRNEQYDWSGVLPGDTSATLWTNFHDFSASVQAINPDCGWVFNSNHSPFFSTAADDAPDSASLPHGAGYLTNHNNRSLRLLEQIEGSDRLSWEDFLTTKYDLRYTDSLYDPVITNWSDLLGLDPETYPDLAEALTILRMWDHETDIHSTGASLFLLSWGYMYKQLFPKGLWRHGYIASEPELVAALRAAVDHCERYFGSVHVPLGDLQRHRRGDTDLPVAGGPQILAALYASEAGDGRYASHTGDGFIQFVRFSQNGPELIETIVPYGASAQPDSPHFTDQMQMYVDHERKVMTLDREIIRQQAEIIYHPQ